MKSILGGSQELRPLLGKVHVLNDIQKHFDSVAPQHLGPSSQVIGLENGMLTIAVNNATIAAKLRQLAPGLVVLLQSSGHQVSGIRVKVQVSYNSGRPKPPPRILSKTAKSALNELSSGMNDSPLKHALEKMSQKRPTRIPDK